MKKIKLENNQYLINNSKTKFPRPLGLVITNMITLTRFIGIVPIITSFLFGNLVKTGIISGIVGITDKLDGWSARYLNGYSSFGASFDACTDKLFAIVLNILLISINPLFILNLIGEIEIGSLNLYYFMCKHIKNKSTMIGKIKTVTLFTEYAFSFFLLHSPIEFLIPITILGNFAFQQKVLFEYHHKAKEKLNVLNTITDTEIKEKMQTPHTYSYDHRKQQIQSLKQMKTMLLDYSIPEEAQELKTDHYKLKIKKY